MAMRAPRFLDVALRYGARNLRRNPRRSTLTVATVALSVFFMLVGLRFTDASMKLWKDGIVEYGAAHAQIRTQAGWKSFQGLAKDHFVNLSANLKTDLLQDPRVAALSERLKFSGMIASGKRSVYFLGESFDPAQEALVCPKLLDRANYEGEFVDQAKEDGIVLGRLLAQTMDLRVGDNATVMVNSLDGQVDSHDVTVIGIVDAPVLELSRRLVYFHLQLSRKLLGAQSGYTELAVRLKEPASLSSWLNSYRARAASEALITLSWWDLQPFVLKIEAVLRSIVALLSGLLFLSAGLAILNIIYLTVEERTIEIGTLMAIGAKAKEIWILLTVEAGVIGVIGGLVGALLATLAILLAGAMGFPFRNPFGAGYVFVHPSFDLITTLTVVALGIVVSLIAALAPALHSTKIDPVSAFRRIAN